MTLAQIPDAMIRDTVAAVFADPDYNRTSLLQRIGAWLLEVFEVLLARFGPGRAPEWLFWIAVTLVTAFVAAVLARASYGMYAGRSPLRTVFAAAGASAGTVADTWQLARELAARGEFTAAAHALYASLLVRIAGWGEIELDEAKTIGDYARELRARSPGRLSRFREFARSYETVIYGFGECDRAGYERLDGLARRVVEVGG